MSQSSKTTETKSSSFAFRVSIKNDNCRLLPPACHWKAQSNAINCNFAFHVEKLLFCSWAAACVLHDETVCRFPQSSHEQCWEGQVLIWICTLTSTLTFISGENWKFKSGRLLSCPLRSRFFRPQTSNLIRKCDWNKWDGWNVITFPMLLIFNKISSENARRAVVERKNAIGRKRSCWTEDKFNICSYFEWFSRLFTCKLMRLQVGDISP